MYLLGSNVRRPRRGDDHTPLPIPYARGILVFAGFMVERVERLTIGHVDRLP